MKVIRKHAKSHHSHLAKLLVHPHETHKHLPLRILEDKVPVHDTGNAVVIGQRVMRRGLKSSLSHINE
jgi:hypothetical protein